MNLEFLLKISYCFAILSFIIIVGNTEKLSIDIAYGQEYTFSKTWGSAGTEDGQFILPHSIAIDIDGNIYVTDTGNNRVQKFNSVGSFITEWGEEGSADGQFRQLHDIAVHPNGKFIYTVELDNHRVQKFFPNGTFISKLDMKKQVEMQKKEVHTNFM